MGRGSFKASSLYLWMCLFALFIAGVVVYGGMIYVYVWFVIPVLVALWFIDELFKGLKRSLRGRRHRRPTFHGNDTCLKCGKTGQRTQTAGNRVGLKCPGCGRFWTTRR